MGKRMSVRAWRGLLFIFLLLLLTAVFAICVGTGSIQIGFADVFKILAGLFHGDPVLKDIVWSIRFPRALGALLGGCSLAIAGLLLQVFFKNPIVEPYVLGVSSGAILCVALVTIGGVQIGFSSLSPAVIFTASLTGSLTVMLVAVLFAGKVRSSVTLLVIGLMVGYICSAVTSILVAFADKDQLQGFTMWTLGSFSGFTWRNVELLIFMVIPAMLAVLFIVKPLNAFLLGEEYAKSMGVNIRLFRIFLVGLSSILAAVVTAFAGPIAFIGLAVPHMARLLFRTSDNGVLLPATILLGGLIASICDLAARTILAPVELPITAVTSFFGAPIVIYLILKRRTSM